MSPRYVDPTARTKRRRSAAPAAPRTPAPLDRVDARLDLDINGPPDQILPAILDPFAQGAVPAVMTRIALDWIIEEPVLNQLFEQAAEDQYTREWALAHFVNVMVDVACGFRPSPRPPSCAASSNGSPRSLPFIASSIAWNWPSPPPSSGTPPSGLGT